MNAQLEIETEIERTDGDGYADALAEYHLKKDGNRTFLCYNKTQKKYYVNWLFTREFLEYKKITIIK